jgi:hypothetical protein
LEGEKLMGYLSRILKIVSCIVLWQIQGGQEPVVGKNHSSSRAEKHVIGCSSSAGFFSSFFAVLNHIRWCEKNNKVPVVYWDSHSNYFQPRGYKGKINVWEYYFHPVSDACYEKEDTVWRNYFAPDGSGIECRAFNGLDMLEHKGWASEVIQKYIKINEQSKKKIDSFYQKYMQGKKTIGIHLRGTDKVKETLPVPATVILEAANKYQGYQFLVTTDEMKLLHLAKNVLKGKVIYYPCFRSRDGKPLHFGKHENKAILGEDVLIEVQLLARCDKILHTGSNVAVAALFFNPTIKHTLFFTQIKKRDF